MVSLLACDCCQQIWSAWHWAICPACSFSSCYGKEKTRSVPPGLLLRFKRCSRRSRACKGAQSHPKLWRLKHNHAARPFPAGGPSHCQWWGFLSLRTEKLLAVPWQWEGARVAVLWFQEQAPALLIRTHFLAPLDCLWNTPLLREQALIFFDGLMAKFSGKLALTSGLGIEKQRILSQQQCNGTISTTKCCRKEL